MKEQEVDPINGYGFIPLLLAAGSAVSGMVQGKAKAKQEKYDAKAAAIQAAKQKEAEQIAAKKKQTMMLLAILGVAGLVMGGIALKRKKR
jgi:1-deoxy-D-xylulose 5-phosphate reductoisomerase